MVIDGFKGRGRGNVMFLFARGLGLGGGIMLVADRISEQRFPGCAVLDGLHARRKHLGSSAFAELNFAAADNCLRVRLVVLHATECRSQQQQRLQKMWLAQILSNV